MHLTPYRSDLLQGKTALVTGAGKGIGRACALALTSCGAQTIAIARTQTDLESLQHECGELLIPLVMDATSDDCLETVKKLESLDILVNNLGTNKVQHLIDVTDDTLDTMLDINIRALVRMTRTVVRHMLKNKTKGSIINMSSQMGHIGSPRRSMYCMTKHAVEGLTKALAVELAEDGIRVNAVAPTFIETPLTKPMLADPDFHQFVMDRIPMKQIGHTRDVANAVIYLASEASALVTGSSLKVDGGWTAQ